MVWSPSCGNLTRVLPQLLCFLIPQLWCYSCGMWRLTQCDSICLVKCLYVILSSLHKVGKLRMSSWLHVGLPQRESTGSSECFTKVFLTWFSLIGSQQPDTSLFWSRGTTTLENVWMKFCRQNVHCLLSVVMYEAQTNLLRNWHGEIFRPNANYPIIVDSY